MLYLHEREKYIESKEREREIHVRLKRQKKKIVIIGLLSNSNY